MGFPLLFSYGCLTTECSVCVILYDVRRNTSKMSFAEGLNNIPILRPNSSSSGADVSCLSEREMKVLKNELKNLRQTIVESLSVNRLEEIVPILSLIAFYKCDPTYKYPSFDFMSMFLWCYMVSYSCV